MFCAVAAMPETSSNPISSQVFISPSRYASLFDESKIGEIGQAVRFGPEPDLSCPGEGLILCLEQTFPIQKYDEHVVLEYHAQCTPSRGWNLVLHAVRPRGKALRRDRQARARLHLIEHNIIFQRIGASDVVVVRVLESPYNPGCSVDTAIHGFECDADFPIAK